MAQVTVTELAKTVGASTERLLSQMKEAGLPHTLGDEEVSDQEKQTLLAHLKGLHGQSASEPKKITLKRKTISTLKSINRKTVNIEVRKKRTYIKRTDEEIRAQADLENEAKERDAQVKLEEKNKGPEIKETDKKPLSKANSTDLSEAKTESGTTSSIDSTKKIPSSTDDLRKANKKAKFASAENSESSNERGRKSSIDDDEDKLAKKAKKVLSKPGKKKPLLDFEENEAQSSSKASIVSSGRVLKLDNKHVFQKPVDRKIIDVAIPDEITVSDLAQKMSLKSALVIKELMKLGVIATINQTIDQETAFLVVEELGHKPMVKEETSVEDELNKQFEKLQNAGQTISRAPIVTIMGHVDHGKTSLLDRIKKSHVAAGEAGGITQHIGAYHVDTKFGSITFLDTPGHAAFTAMRARGASVTDIVILVVAGDDGVMPQTEEAIQHARAAGVPIIVAINKMDKEGADPDKVTNELVAQEVIPEEYGGDVQFVRVSAETGDGLDTLLEAVTLQSELLELTASVDIPSRGIIVEARIDKGRGVVATALVQHGTLKKGDFIVAGESVGKIRAMTNEKNAMISEAAPSVPAEILGLDEAPNAGDEFFVIADERRAKELASLRAEKARQERVARQQATKLETMLFDMDGNKASKLNLIIKADVKGSLEAINGAITDFSNDEVMVNIVSSGVGGITESDINLALTTEAIVIGFNVRASSSAKALAEKENVEFRYYSIIYKLIDEVKLALSGMLAPELKEEIIGLAEVRDVFRSPKFGAIAGCMVVEGAVSRNQPIRVLRDDIVIFEGELESLRRFKDEASEVRSGMECGIGVKDYNDVKVGDQIEVFEIKSIKRSL